jgi:methylated-DNA-[protein]-cysteine S-methyltransferase
MPQLSLHTPLGPLTLSEEDGAIVALDWGWGRDQTETPLLSRGRDQLHAYFDGSLKSFDLPVTPSGTPYRRRVWQALDAIPYGETRTYQQIAMTAGGSPRSVGGANGANPVPIIIPCHRVIATTGIGGYSGGDGIATKKFLLALERDRAGARYHGDQSHSGALFVSVIHTAGKPNSSDHALERSDPCGARAAAPRHPEEP